ncbi:unnamed protein product [Ascophyllum nodosum]
MKTASGSVTKTKESIWIKKRRTSAAWQLTIAAVHRTPSLVPERSKKIIIDKIFEGRGSSWRGHRRRRRRYRRSQVRVAATAGISHGAEIVPEGSVLEREHTVAPVVLARTHSVISAVRNQLEGDKVTPEERDVNRAETGTSAEEQQKNMPASDGEMAQDDSRRRRPSPISVSTQPRRNLGTWRKLSPRMAARLFGGVGGRTGAEDFTNPLSPRRSPMFSSRGRGDTRRRILLNMTYTNLFLACVLIILGGVGPRYPGHSGTTNNAHSNGINRGLTTQDSPLYLANCPTDEVDSANASVLHSALIVGLIVWLTQPCSALRISKELDRIGSASTLLTSVVCALTCLGAFAVVMVDINYIGGCCSLLEDNCEVSNLCTPFVSDCCIGDDVKDYCGNPSYHVGAVAMIFLVFASTSAMMIMSCTMACQCWLGSDPDRQAMMMVLARGQSRLPPISPKFSPRASLLSALGDHRALSPSGRPPKLGGWRDRPLDVSGTSRGGGGRFGNDGTGDPNASAPVAITTTTKEMCYLCRAVFSDRATLENHVSRFHPKGMTSPGGAAGKQTQVKLAALSKPLARKTSHYIPDEALDVCEAGTGES